MKIHADSFCPANAQHRIQQRIQLVHLGLNLLQALFFLLFVQPFVVLNQDATGCQNNSQRGTKLMRDHRHKARLEFVQLLFLLQGAHQFLFNHLAFGHIAHTAHNAANLMPLYNRGQGHIRLELAAITAAAGQFNPPWLVGIHHPAQHILQAVCMIRLRESHQRLAHHLLCRVAKHGRKRRVHLLDLAFRISKDDGIAAVIQHRLHPFLFLTQFSSALCDSLFQFVRIIFQRFFRPLALADIAGDGG